VSWIIVHKIQLEIFRSKLLLQIQSFIFAFAPSMKWPLILTKYHNVDKLHRPTVQRYIWPIFSKELFSSRICLREAGYQLNLPLGLHNLWLVSSKILLILKNYIHQYFPAEQVFENWARSEINDPAKQKSNAYKISMNTKIYHVQYTFYVNLLIRKCSV